MDWGTDGRLIAALSPWTALHLLQAENQSNLEAVHKLPAHLLVASTVFIFSPLHAGPTTHIQPLGTGSRLIPPALKTLLEKVFIPPRPHQVFLSLWFTPIHILPSLRLSLLL